MPVKIRALQLKMLMKPLPSKNQVPVVKRLDNTIHQIDHHPVDNIIHLLNNLAKWVVFNKTRPGWATLNTTTMIRHPCPKGVQTLLETNIFRSSKLELSPPDGKR